MRLERVMGPILLFFTPQKSYTKAREENARRILFCKHFTKAGLIIEE